MKNWMSIMYLFFLRPERIWDYAVIPYEIDSNFSGVHKVILL